ncbi:MAG: hypothetical protein ACRDRO_03295 [Pseudonocardiaceae bacterium]
MEVGGHGVVSHAGSGLLRLVADRVGLTGALSRALVRSGFWPVHDRGRVLTDLAVMIADGGTTISAIDTLRHQGELFGSVASDTTVWRALEEITPARLDKIAKARARVRGHVWKRIVARHGRIPPARVAGGDLGRPAWWTVSKPPKSRSWLVPLGCPFTPGTHEERFPCSLGQATKGPAS